MIFIYNIDIYQTLEVSRECWQQHSQQAGGQLRQQHHGDRRVGQKQVTRTAKPSFSLDLNNKYQVLTDQNGEVFILN